MHDWWKTIRIVVEASYVVEATIYLLLGAAVVLGLLGYAVYLAWPR